MTAGRRNARLVKATPRPVFRVRSSSGKDTQAWLVAIQTDGTARCGCPAATYRGGCAHQAIAAQSYARRVARREIPAVAS